MKKIWRWGVLAVSCLLCGCQLAEPLEDVSSVKATKEESSADEVLYLSMAAGGNWSDSANGKILKEQLEQLEELSGGKLKIKIYDRCRLGDDEYIIHGIPQNTLDMVLSAPGTQISVVPEAALLEVPGMFESLEEWNEFLQGSYRETMQTYYSESGMKILALFTGAYRELSSNQKIETVQDFSSLKIRVISNEYHEAFWNSLGAEAVPYSSGKLRFCIQSGMVQAQENPLGVLLSENLMDLQNSVIMTDHLPMIYAMLISEDRYNSLSEEQQEWLWEFAENLQEAVIAQMPELNEQALETLQNDYAISCVNPPDGWKELLDQGKNTVLELLRKNLGDEKVDIMLENAEEIQRDPAK